MKMAGSAEKAPVKRRGKPDPKTYWQRRRNSIYLFAARQICARERRNPTAVIDIGSNATPTLEWHRKSGARLVSLDLRRPYVAEGVESLTCDFLEYNPATSYDLVTCFQVLEHVPDPAAFARKLLAIGKTVVVSVPYKWKKGRCKYHLHDPVDERKMKKWFGRDPDYSYIAKELNNVARLIQVYRQ
ncbi:MAG TPA: methyltransferase domain-containing protein [Woeseiaceae bacterium]|nr:methyltransferase domain-containing protein [Woeseiaceae bacterium]